MEMNFLQMEVCLMVNKFIEMEHKINTQLKFGSILYCLIPYKPDSKIVMLQYISEEEYLKGLSYKCAGYLTYDEIENELIKINKQKSNEHIKATYFSI